MYSQQPNRPAQRPPPSYQHPQRQNCTKGMGMGMGMVMVMVVEMVMVMVMVMVVEMVMVIGLIGRD